jgi:hypothetical protein
MKAGSAFSKTLIRISSFLFIFTALAVFECLGQEPSAAEKIAARFAGPFHLRFIFQPLLAIILRIRDGRNDARNNNPPYIFEVFTDKVNRKQNIRKGLKAILTPLIIGIILDAFVQFNLFHSVRLWGAVVVGGFIIGLPYALSRGITNRISPIGRKKENDI